jgi:glutamine cyclotransferase
MNMNLRKYIISLSALKAVCLTLCMMGFLISCNETPKTIIKTETVTPPKNTVAEIPYSVLNTLPHDPSSFTEGFLFHNNQLFESTGATAELPQTKSLFGIVDVKTGKIDTKAELDKTVYFGEGIVVLKNKIYQVTYKNQVGFIYDATTYKKIGQFNYANKEGWGLTTDGISIIMSDGSNVLTYFNPKGMTVTKTLSVSNNGYAEDYLNELEYINGFIYANVWLKNYLVKINPTDGKIVGIIDLSAIEGKERMTNVSAKEMNGIAFDSANNKILVTGKMWATIYQIDFAH